MSKRELKTGVEDLPGMLPNSWASLFQEAGVLREALTLSRSQRSRATLIGKFFAANLDRAVPIVVRGRPARATLRAVDAGQRQRRYYFEIFMDGDGPPGDVPKANPAGEPAGPRRSDTTRAGGPRGKTSRRKKRSLDD